MCRLLDRFGFFVIMAGHCVKLYHDKRQQKLRQSLISSNPTYSALPGKMFVASARGAVMSAALRLFFCVVFLLANIGFLRAQPAIEDIENIRIPTDLSQVEFYLITVDVGDHVWDNFGHTALRIVDNSTDTDLMFNWGLFDTSVGYVRFAANFALGNMDYQLGVSPPEWELGRYQQEGRTVWQDRLRLTEAQKRTLYQRLAWNIRPGNIEYAYDYFFDNCTTRVRDYLDEAFNGTLASNSTALTSRTFRDEVLSHYASVPLLRFSLDILLNERVDQRMTQWQQMFLPLQLREQLQRQGLLADSQTLMQFTPPASGVNPYWLAGLLMLPVLLLLAGVRRASIASFSSQPGFTLLMPGMSYRLLGLIGLGIALLSGVYGLMLSLGWWLSGHQDIHGNMNLLLFWPTDLLGLGVALHWFLKGKAYSVSVTRKRVVVAYLMLHVLAALIYLLMGLSGLGEQRVGSLMLYVVPLLVLYTLLMLIAGVRPVRSLSFN